jgi:hypothetical protein
MMKIILHLAVMAGTAFIGTPVSPMHGQESVQATTTVNLNLRSGTSTNAQVLTVIPSATQIPLTECRTGWCSATFENISGYVAARYLRINSYSGGRPTTNPASGPRPAEGDSGTLRKEPRTLQGSAAGPGDTTHSGATKADSTTLSSIEVAAFGAAFKASNVPLSLVLIVLGLLVVGVICTIYFGNHGRENAGIASGVVSVFLFLLVVFLAGDWWGKRGANKKIDQTVVHGASSNTIAGYSREPNC